VRCLFSHVDAVVFVHVSFHPHTQLNCRSHDG
jgi:hypothetical protein